MSSSPLRAIVSYTFKETIRSKWLIMFTLVFFLLTLNIPLLILLATSYIPPNYLDIYLTYLVSLSFPFLPFLSLPLVATSIVDERESGSLQYMLSNPISRVQFLTGRLVGLILATTLVIVLGYGIATIVTYKVAVSRYAAAGMVMLVAAFLNLCIIGLALVVSILTRRKATALGIAIFIWFILTVLSDFGSLGLVLTVITKQPAFVMPLILANPVETSRVLALIPLHAGPTELGSTGLIVNLVLGDNGWIVLFADVALWITVLTSLSYFLFKRQDFN